MHRITLAALAASAVLSAGAASAQQPPIDWDKIEIKTTDLGNKTYRLEGQGGNITVAVGTDGIIMVDGQFAPLSAKIKAAIAAISPLPIKYQEVVAARPLADLDAKWAVNDAGAVAFTRMVYNSFKRS
jgi:cyclase